MPTSQNIAHALDEGRSSNGAAPPRRYPPLGVVIKNAGSGQLQRILADEVELRSRCEEEGLDYQTARSMIDRELDRRQRQIRPLVAASYEFASAKAEMSRELAARFSPAFNQFYESLGRCEECGVPFDLRKRKRFCSDAHAARHRMRGREKVGNGKSAYENAQARRDKKAIRHLSSCPLGKAGHGTQPCHRPNLHRASLGDLHRPGGARTRHGESMSLSDARNPETDETDARPESHTVHREA